MTTVAFLLTEGVHLLDLAGPAQVFSTAADFGHPYELSYVGPAPVVTTHQGVRSARRPTCPHCPRQTW